MSRLNRRQFLGGSLAAGAVLALPSSRILGANNDIRLGVIGVGSHVKIGGMGRNEIAAHLKLPGLRFTALCDCDKANLMPEVEKLHAHNPSLKAYTDLRELLDDKNVDAVIVTTPNHWHALATIWACQAGKDVYVQKPTAHTIFEGRKMVEAAAKYQRIVQAPHGPRERTGFAEAFEYVRQGHLGKILYAHGINYKPRESIGRVTGPQPIPDTINYDLWCGPADKLPLMRQYLHYDWHWDWNTGNGDLGNMGIHYMDGCRWGLGQNTLPRHVMSLGGRFGYEDDGRTPNTQIIFLDYDPAPILFEVRGLPKSKAQRKETWAPSTWTNTTACRSPRSSAARTATSPTAPPAGPPPTTTMTSSFRNSSRPVRICAPTSSTRSAAVAPKTWFAPCCRVTTRPPASTWVTSPTAWAKRCPAKRSARPSRAKRPLPKPSTASWPTWMPTRST